MRALIGSRRNYPNLLFQKPHHPSCERRTLIISSEYRWTIKLIQHGKYYAKEGVSINDSVHVIMHFSPVCVYNNLSVLIYCKESMNIISFLWEIPFSTSLSGLIFHNVPQSNFNYGFHMLPYGWYSFGDWENIPLYIYLNVHDCAQERCTYGSPK